MRRVLAAAMAVAILATAVPRLASAQAPAAPRTLVLVLDGLPFRVVERAVAEGAFAGWPAPAKLIGPFPSMTNPSLTLMLSPLGVPPAPGYEVQHYDWSANAIHGGGAFEYNDGAFPWRGFVQVPKNSLPAKFGGYVRPKGRFEHELKWAEGVVFEDARDVLILHAGALDALQHLKGDAVVVPLMTTLDAWARALAARHERERGRPLRIVLLSDHGNSAAKIRRMFNGRDCLRGAGLRVTKTLERPGDVVVGTFGVNGYAPLYCDDAHAETTARAMLAHPGVDLAAWHAGPGEVRVISDEGDATVRWSDDGSARLLRYEAGSADPLALLPAVERLRAQGRLDAAGFATAEAWLAATADDAYPDAPWRLVEGLTGAHVVNRATVLLSLEPGWAWGWKSAAVFAWFRGGALEGTHGGLDRDSSVGFLLANDPSLMPGAVVRAGTALGPALSGAAE